MGSLNFNIVLRWLREERRIYQTKKFDYKTETVIENADADYWEQQFNSYIQRIKVFGLDTTQGFQATLKLAATAVACAEHYADRNVEFPKPGVSSGTIEPW